MEASNGSQVKVKATAGPVLGPPWQRPENGYLVTSPQGQLTLYLEPHCVYDKTFLEKERVYIIITPVIKQLLPSFTLVSGQEDAVQLAKTLCAKFIVPMQYGELDAKGILAALIQSSGTLESFQKMEQSNTLGSGMMFWKCPLPCLFRSHLWTSPLLNKGSVFCHGVAISSTSALAMTTYRLSSGFGTCTIWNLLPSYFKRNPSERQPGILNVLVLFFTQEAPTYTCGHLPGLIV